MGKDPNELYEKGKLLYKAKQFKKAGKFFSNAGEEFESLNDFESGKRSYIKGAQAYLEKDEFLKSIQLLRKASHVSILKDQFKEALEIFHKAIMIGSKLEKVKERDEMQLLFTTFSFLSYFLIGEYDKGILAVKKAKKVVDDNYFKENDFIQLIKDFLIIIKNQNLNYLKKVESEIPPYDFLEGENKLIKTAIIIAKIFLLLKSEVEYDKEVYTTNDIMHLKISLDLSIIRELSNDKLNDFKCNEIKITKFNLQLTSNFTTHEKPEVPIFLDLTRENTVNFVIKPHFQVEKSQIGPITFTFLIDDMFLFNHDIMPLTPKLISPPPALTFSAKNLRPPLIDQTFPLQILVENTSEGDALDLNLSVSLPDQLKLIRGTLEKNVYSLNSNESISWELQLRPIETGDFEIKMMVLFKDPDGNSIENVEHFPISIKL